jgi:vacuolar protein sorting-associated protein 13A/C
LAYFERVFVFYNRAQLQSEIISHYSGQFVKQLYVLVSEWSNFMCTMRSVLLLGSRIGHYRKPVRSRPRSLDRCGDFLLRAVPGDIDSVLLWQRVGFQGIIQGPQEFGEGLALGVRSLFGHTVGGAAGAASRITGTLGKGVAALTMDDDYQRRRQEAINRRPQNFGEGMARGVKGLGQGVASGVTGVFTKPLEGAREGGVGGFAKVGILGTCYN